MNKAACVMLLSVCGAAVAGCASSVAGSSAVVAHEAETPGVEYAYSQERRTILTRTIGNAGPGVLIFGGIHGSEPEGLAPTQRLIEVLQNDTWPAQIVVVEDMNPDGSTLLSRYNARGVDLNRNWPASNFESSFRHGEEALSEIETQYAYTLIQRVDPVLVIVLHSIHSGPFVNYDGPGIGYAEVFASAADDADRSHTWNLQADMGYETPGSMGTYVGVDRGTPILTIEFDRGHDEESATAALIAGVRAVLDKVVTD
jgi:protein MpaA